MRVERRSPALEQYHRLAAAVFGRDYGAVEVHPRQRRPVLAQARGKHAVKTDFVESFAQFENGRVGNVEFPHGKIGLSRDVRFVLRPPTHSAEILEKRVDGIERAALGMSAKGDVFFAVRFHCNCVITEFGEVRNARNFARRGTVADENRRRRFVAFRETYDFEISARHCIEVRFQLASRRPFDRRGIVGQYNLRNRERFFGKFHICNRRSDKRQQSNPKSQNMLHKSKKKNPPAPVNTFGQSLPKMSK